jgi:hypothetical protein
LYCITSSDHYYQIATPALSQWWWKTYTRPIEGPKQCLDNFPETNRLSLRTHGATITLLFPAQSVKKRAAQPQFDSRQRQYRRFPTRGPNGPRVHTYSYPKHTRSSLAGGEAAGVRSWLLTSIPPYTFMVLCFIYISTGACTLPLPPPSRTLKPSVTSPLSYTLANYHLSIQGSV